ncbi:MAG: FHA domain-containing protein [Planctomycetota bacterium]|nr:FHA domain-containing protein [Planctomycetota bacterium]
MSIQLVMSTKDGSMRAFDISEESTTIGSKRSCDLHVAIPTVAPLHCEITINGDGINLLNRSPESETRLNDVIVQSAPLKNEDKVRVGPVEFTVNITDEETVIRRV